MLRKINSTVAGAVAGARAWGVMREPSAIRSPRLRFIKQDILILLLEVREFCDHNSHMKFHKTMAQTLYQKTLSPTDLVST